MRFPLFLGALLIVTTAAIGQQEASKPFSPFDQELITIQKDFLQANLDRNANLVNQFASDDFRGVATNGDLYDREELIANTHEGLPKDLLSYEFHVVRIDDNCAVVVYNLVVPGGDPRYRHMSDTWTKTDGKWKLKFQQITPNLWSAHDFD